MGQLTKDGETLIDLLACQRLQPFCAEALHGERSHHAAIEHRVLENVARDFALRRDVAHEATGEAVAGTGGVAHFFQRQRRSSERMMTSSKLPVAEKDSRAVLAVFDHQGLWPQLQYFSRRARQAVITRQHLGLGIIDE